MFAALVTLSYLVSVALASVSPAPTRPMTRSFAPSALLTPWLFSANSAPLGNWSRERVPGPLGLSMESDGFHYGIWSITGGPEIPSVFWRGTLDFGRSIERISPVDALWFPEARRGTGNSWSNLGLQANDIRLSHSHETDLLWAKVNGKTTLIDPSAVTYVPLRRSGWQTEESLRMPVLGSLFVVGQVGANSTSVEWQQYKLVGKGGLGWKLPSWLGGEIQVRSGRSLTNYDSDTEMLIPEQMKKFVELTTRWPVADWLNLEYTGEATAAHTPTARDVLKHELRLAVPISNTGQFHIGAKYRSEDATAQSLWYERMKLLIGLELKH